ncbi:MAG: sulfotransferase domain-containing protein [Cyanobacteria bacterium P01_F01_bin.86]
MVDNFVLMVGAMKCGTTSLFRYLAEHPQVCPCEFKKEPNFFEHDKNYAKGFEWYQSLWNYDPAIHKVALEGTTNYTKFRTSKVVDRIAEVQQNFNCGFRFIYIMRNPIERIESHYTHGLSTKWGQKLMKLDRGVDPKLIEISSYAKQITEYQKRFSASDILLLNFDDLKRDTPNTLKQICQFLEIDTAFDFQNTSKNYHPTQGKLIDGPLWPFVEPGTRFIPKRYRQAIRQRLGQTIKGNLKLSLEQRDFVLDELKDDLRKLKVEYDVDISSWGIEI